MEEEKNLIIYQTYFKEYSDILDVEQLSEVLKVGKRTVYHLLQKKEIKFQRIGKKYYILKKDVLIYLGLLNNNNESV